MELDYIEFGYAKVQLFRRFNLLAHALPIVFAAPTALVEATGYAFAPQLKRTSGVRFPAKKENPAVREGNMVSSLQEVIFDYF